MKHYSLLGVSSGDETLRLMFDTSITSMCTWVYATALNETYELVLLCSVE